MTRLRRALRLRDAVAIGINAVIGTGIFFLPGLAAAQLGPAALLTFVISAVLCSLVVLCYAEAGARFRRTGGSMLFAREAFGDFAGFSVGWLVIAAGMVGWAAVSNAMVAALAVMVPGAEDFRALILCVLYAALAGANMRGVRLGAGIGNFFTVAKLLPILLFIGVGLFHIDASLYTPFAPHGLGSLGSGTLVIFFAFVGFEVVALPAGELTSPRTMIPRALLLSMGLVLVVYLLIWAVCAGTLETLAGSKTPVQDAALGFLGPTGWWILSIGIVCSVLGVNANAALAGPRSLYAFAEARHVPAVFRRVHARTRAPVPAILAYSGLSLAAALTGNFAQLAVITVSARLVQYISTCLAVLVLRRRRPEEGIPFRIPGGPVVPVCALGLCGWLFSQTDRAHLQLGLTVLGVGVAVYVARRFLRRRPV